MSPRDFTLALGPEGRGSPKLERNGFGLCLFVSDGETCCDGGHDIPAGRQVWSQRASYEYDEWSYYCRRCAFAQTRWSPRIDRRRPYVGWDAFNLRPRSRRRRRLRHG